MIGAAGTMAIPATHNAHFDGKSMIGAAGSDAVWDRNHRGAHLFLRGKIRDDTIDEHAILLRKNVSHGEHAGGSVQVLRVRLYVSKLRHSVCEAAFVVWPCPAATFLQTEKSTICCR